MSRVSLNLDGPTPKPTLIAEWVTGAGNRLWIIRVSQEQTLTESALSSSSAVLPSLQDFVLSSTTLSALSTLTSSADVATPSSSETTNAQLTPQDLSTPSWWSGDCDYNTYRAKAGTGSYRLGAVYLGMPACGPFPGTDVTVHFFSGAFPILEWECVELSMRYLYLAFGIAPYSANGKDVVWNYNGTLLQKIGNGTPNQAPQAGDVLSYGPTALFGHTSVVTNSSVDGNGHGTLTVIEQNESKGGSSSLSVNNWTVTGGPYPVSGWLHHGSTSSCPGPALNSPADGAVSTSQNVTFSWNAPSGCTFSGYTFRIKNVSSMDSGGTTIVDTGEANTQHTSTITGFDNQDLYWGVRTANPNTV